MRLTISRKLYLGFGGVLTLLGVVGVAGYRSALATERAAAAIEDLRGVSEAQGRVTAGFLECVASARRYQITTVEDDLAAYQKDASRTHDLLGDATTKVKGTPLEPGMARMNAVFADFSARFNAVIELMHRMNGFTAEMDGFNKAISNSFAALHEAGKATPKSVIDAERSFLEARGNAWKLRATRDMTIADVALARCDDAVKSADAALEQLQSTDSAADAQSLRDAIAKYHGELASLKEAMQNRAELLAQMKSVVSDVMQSQSDLEQALEKYSSSISTAQDADARRAKQIAISVTAVAAILGTFTALFIARGVTRRVATIKDRVQQIQTTRNLKQRVDLAATDELGELAQSFDTFVGDLHAVIKTAGSAATNVAAAATEVSASAEQLSRGIQTQSSQITQVSAAVEENTQSVVEVARKSSDAASQSKNSGACASKGGEIVTRTIDQMEQINTQVTSTAAAMQQLESKSNQIGEIIKVINEIAEQTNLLALNAAIEAARAGEHGRGFAVVADEVRKLAERTTNATDEVSGSIQEIQREIKSAGESMRHNTERVHSGVELARTAGDALSQIMQGSGTVESAIASIAAAAEQQSAAGEEIARSIQQINAIANESTSAATQSAAAASQLSAEAEKLQSLVAQFVV